MKKPKTMYTNAPGIFCVCLFHNWNLKLTFSTAMSMFFFLVFSAACYY